MERLGIRPDLLRELSGIMERRVWDEGTMPSEVAARAGEKAIEAAGIDRSKIGILINTSVCRDYLEPSTACIAHSMLGLPETCMNFDLGNACLGFVNGMDMVGNMIERGEVDYGILVNGETSRQITEADRRAAAESRHRRGDLQGELRLPDPRFRRGGDGARPARSANRGATRSRAASTSLRPNTAACAPATSTTW